MKLRIPRLRLLTLLLLIALFAGIFGTFRMIEQRRRYEEWRRKQEYYYQIILSYSEYEQNCRRLASDPAHSEIEAARWRDEAEKCAKVVRAYEALARSPGQSEPTELEAHPGKTQYDTGEIRARLGGR